MQNWCRIFQDVFFSKREVSCLIGFVMLNSLSTAASHFYTGMQIQPAAAANNHPHTVRKSQTRIFVIDQNNIPDGVFLYHSYSCTTAVLTMFFTKMMITCRLSCFHSKWNCLEGKNRQWKSFQDHSQRPLLTAKCHKSKMVKFYLRNESLTWII